GFTKFTCAEYLKSKSEGRIASDGVNAKDKKHQLYVISALAGTKIDMKSWTINMRHHLRRQLII
ncbi:hypothetical protein ACJX0J_040503, partial [Zea mays]